jgi:hypothetical protein
MNICLTKLTETLNLKTRMLLSTCGNFIYMLVKSDDSDLSKFAMDMKSQAQMEIGINDLSSLEPCDDNFQKLRQQGGKTSYILQLEKELLPLFSIIENGEVQVEKNDGKSNVHPKLFEAYESNFSAHSLK